MCQLLKYWGQLETRTKQVIDLLSYAARARCSTNEPNAKNSNDSIPSRAERKLRDKQKKALAAVESLMERGSEGTTLYEPFCTLLEERAKMRSQWLERENDRVFMFMSSEYAPIPVPFEFNSTGVSKSAELGSSPLVGTPEGLIQLSNELKRYGNAFITRKSSDLPKDTASKAAVKENKETLKDTASKPPVKENKETPKKELQEGEGKPPSSNPLETVQEQLGEPPAKPSGKEHEDPEKKALKKTADKTKQDEQQEQQPVKSPITAAAAVTAAATTEHQKDLKWKRWNSIKVGLEMQEPWAGLLLNGSKSIETRAYALPNALIGKKIDILQSKRGKDGISSLSDVMEGKEIDEAVQRVGWCIFDKVVVYRYKAKFEADEKKHLVKPDSDYGWNDETTVVYGWVVSKSGKYKKGKSNKDAKCLVRRMRSLYECS